MVECRDVIIFPLIAVLLVKHRQFEMRHGRPWIDFKGFFKGGNRPFVIPAAKAVFAFKEIRIALLIDLRFAYRRTAKQEREQQGKGKGPKQHDCQLKRMPCAAQRRSLAWSVIICG